MTKIDNNKKKDKISHFYISANPRGALDLPAAGGASAGRPFTITYTSQLA